MEQTAGWFSWAGDTRQRQSANIVFITFWSQFAVYALNTILILFLTRPLLKHGLGYSQAKAYIFFGVTQATGYLMPILGGFMADRVLGLRRAILVGSMLLAIAYLLIMLSGMTIGQMGDTLFIAAYALIPASNALLMGTASGMVSRIYSDDAVRAKSAMTLYYMAINVGALLATIIAPSLLESRYGPLSVLALAFAGKSLSALNFAARFRLYDNVIEGQDTRRIGLRGWGQLVGFILAVYAFTLMAYSHVELASRLIGIGCALGMGWFLLQTLKLSGAARSRQLLAWLLILEAVVFFIIYNQMNSTLILFAESNSNLKLFGFSISAAHYQLINPLLIVFFGLQLPRFYQRFPRFDIPWQFASGTLLAGGALLIVSFAGDHEGIVSGEWVGLSYALLTLAELWVSAIGLSMIGLYCDSKNLAFAMGVWYLACSMSNTISGHLASAAAEAEHAATALQSLAVYQQYYFKLGITAIVLGLLMMALASVVRRAFARRGLVLA